MALSKGFNSNVQWTEQIRNQYKNMQNVGKTYISAEHIRNPSHGFHKSVKTLVNVHSAYCHGVKSMSLGSTPVAFSVAVFSSGSLPEAAVTS